MSHKRSRFKDTSRGMTLAMVTETFSPEGIDEEVALEEISRAQRLFTVKVLLVRISEGGRSLLMVIGIPTQELSDAAAAERCAWYDKKLEASGFGKYCGFPQVGKRHVWHPHAYTGAQLNSLSCFMRDLIKDICYQTGKKREGTVSELSVRPTVHGKYTCQWLDPLNMPRFFDKAAMHAMRGRLAAAGQRFRLNWGARSLYVSRYAAGGRDYVNRVEGIVEPPRNKREAKRVRNACSYTEDALWHLYKHAKYIYGDKLESELGNLFLMEFAKDGLHALGRSGTSLDARDSRATAMMFLPVILAICVGNGLFRWWTKRRLKKSGRLQKLWAEAFRQAKRDYGMGDAPTPALA